MNQELGEVVSEHFSALFHQEVSLLKAANRPMRPPDSDPEGVPEVLVTNAGTHDQTQGDGHVGRAQASQLVS